MSPQRAVLAQMNLSPGSYGAVCFVLLEDGTPHVMPGMPEVFTVAVPQTRWRLAAT